MGFFCQGNIGKLPRKEAAALDRCLCGRDDEKEKDQITENMFGSYDEEKGLYTSGVVQQARYKSMSCMKRYWLGSRWTKTRTKRSQQLSLSR